ncbi:unnamed protein product [Dicrocoelium dendriticum]|nr:unnamed protein product [Dicrocoelium dendriticum]
MVTEKKLTRWTSLAFGGQPSFSLPTALKMMESTLPDNWKAWKANWMEFAALIQLDEYPKSYQMAMFRYAIGHEACRIMKPWNFCDHDGVMDLSQIIERFENYCDGRLTLLASCGRLVDAFSVDSECQQATNDSITKYSNGLSEQECVFPTPLTQMRPASSHHDLTTTDNTLLPESCIRIECSSTQSLQRVERTEAAAERKHCHKN